MSFLNSLTNAPSDPIFGLNAILKADQRKEKVDLLIGYYRNEESITPIFEAVRLAHQKLFSKQKDLNYLPIDGSSSFIDGIKSLCFEKKLHSNIYGAQSVGGTSALHHLGVLLKLCGNKKISIPDPSWANHRQIFEYLGYDLDFYPYYDPANQKLLFEEMKAHLSGLEKGTTVLFHASCHNPSGQDLNLQQWQEICEICKKHSLIPLFDSAYQGLGSGIHQDVSSINLFSSHLDEVFLAYSCSKNFGLYGERTGACFIYSKNEKHIDAVSSIMKQSMRATYSNPPRTGALIVAEIFSDEKLYKLWETELNSYQRRIKLLRSKYRKSLEPYLNKDLSSIEHGNGLFIYTGLSAKKVEALRENDAIYLASDGRLNITGLNDKNFDQVIETLKKYL